MGSSKNKNVTKWYDWMYTSFWNGAEEISKKKSITPRRSNQIPDLVFY